jgi:hypothetical protein
MLGFSAIGAFYVIVTLMEIYFGAKRRKEGMNALYNRAIDNCNKMINIIDELYDFDIPSNMKLQLNEAEKEYRKGIDLATTRLNEMRYSSMEEDLGAFVSLDMITVQITRIHKQYKEKAANSG